MERTNNLAEILSVNRENFCSVDTVIRKYPAHLLGTNFEVPAQTFYMPGEAQRKLLFRIANRLRAKQETVAVAESVTAGMLQLSVGSTENASEFFQGGMTLYNLGQKCIHLGVEPIEAQQQNCVSLKVAAQMAMGITHKFRSDWGLALTGYATPVPESDNKLYACYAIVYRDTVKAKGKIRSTHKDPQQVQEQYVMAVLKKWWEEVRKPKSQKDRKKA